MISNFKKGMFIMTEKNIINEKASKLNFLVLIPALATLALLVLSFDMLIGGDSNTAMWFILTFAMAVVTVIVYLATAGCEIVVTDKRIYGKVAFGKRVDLPLDSVSAVATTAFTQGVSVSTSSGRITFLFLAKKEKIASTIRKLLVERQQKPVAATTIKQEIPQSNAEELRKYKELLDMGVISKEEFDAKKKQLLGL